MSAGYLDKVCESNLSLRASVESLLKSHEETGDFVDAPGYQAAANMLPDGVEFKSGRTVAHYKILSLLGEGGMGRVYLADDTKLHRKVSLKFLSHSLTDDQQRLRRFEQEARAVSALNHPNTLKIHEISEVARNPAGCATRVGKTDNGRKILPKREVRMMKALKYYRVIAIGRSVGSFAGLDDCAGGVHALDLHVTYASLEAHPMNYSGPCPGVSDAVEFAHEGEGLTDFVSLFLYEDVQTSCREAKLPTYVPH